ncbi:MAG: DUF4177 domain-containing protein [Candidatus Krumholzibacteriia bacterium]
MSYEYRVEPFIGRIKSKGSANEVSAQLSALINSNARDGWEFCQIADVNIAVKPGCLAGFLGSKTDYVRFDQVVFRRPATD